MAQSVVDRILARLLALHPKRIDLSLQRMERLLAALGHPERRLPPVIHVAGTNGKGSSIAFMRAMLEAGGLRVHVYTSPHLVAFNERIRLAGKLADEVALEAALVHCERVNDGAPITFFEMTTAVAFTLFAQVPADVLLLEVGLGGRLDATNVVTDPLCTAITPISMDHVEFLGDRLTKIAEEKAGIVKLRCPVVSAPQPPEALEVLEGIAQARKAPLIAAGRDYQAWEEAGRMIYQDEQALLDLPLPRLLGRHQIDNAALALATLRRVWPSLPETALAQGLRSAQWPARIQRLKPGPLSLLAPAGAEVWLDGGHNEAGGRALAEFLARLAQRDPRPLVLIYGALQSKDSSAFFHAFRALSPLTIATPVNAEQASRAPADVAALAREQGLSACAADSLDEAFRAIPDTHPAPRVVIAGSLYLAGAVLFANGEPPQ